MNNQNTITFIPQDISPLLIYMNMPIPSRPTPSRSIRPPLKPSGRYVRNPRLSSFPRLFYGRLIRRICERREKEKKNNTKGRKAVRKSFPFCLTPLELARYDMICYVKGKRKEEKVRRQSKAPETPRFFRSRVPQKKKCSSVIRYPA